VRDDRRAPPGSEREGRERSGLAVASAGPCPKKRKRGRRGVGWTSRPRRRGTRFFFIFLNQISNAFIN